jgi:hypothetical protein
MSTRIYGAGALVTLVSAAAALVPTSRAAAHEPATGSPGGAGGAAVSHHGGTHRYGSVCAFGATDVTGWFWLADGSPFVGFVPQDGVCFGWEMPARVVSLYACDHKGCSAPVYV